MEWRPEFRITAPLLYPVARGQAQYETYRPMIRARQLGVTPSREKLAGPEAPSELPVAAIPGGWLATVFLGLAAMLNYADRTALSVVLAPIRNDLRLTDVDLGLVSSIFLWSYAATSPFAGMLADRYSRRTLVVLSLVLWSVVTGMTGLASGLVSLCIFRLALGIFESAFHPAAFALVAELHGSSTRARAMSLLSLGFQSGIVVGGSIAGYVAEKFGWQAAFYALAGLGLCLTATWRLFFRSAPPSPSATCPATLAPQRPASAALKYLVAVPSFYAIVFKAMLIGSTTFVFFAWIPLYVFETFHMTLGAAGFAGTFMLQGSKLIGIAGGAWCSDVFARSVGRRRILLQAWCYLAAAPFLLIFLGDHPFSVVVLGVSFFSLFNGMGLANEQPSLCEIVPSCYRSTAIGVYNTCATAAGGLGVLMAGILKKDWGLQRIFSASSVSYTIAGFLLTIVYLTCVKRDTARARDFEQGLPGSG